jgi:ubiquinone/menaquinone biosynthesis C-methylase UbiE
MATVQALLRRAASSLVSRPLIYDAVQVLAGSRKCYSHLKRSLPNISDKGVLDVGGGTGRAIAVLDPSARYACLDMDPQKLIRLREKYPAAGVMVGDAAAIPARDGEFELALCVFVAHHLEDNVLRAALAELRRVCGGTTFIMEPLWVPSRRVSRMLWHYDQGANPRSLAALQVEVERYFEIEGIEQWSVFHQYVLIRCRPRDK